VKPGSRRILARSFLALTAVVVFGIGLERTADRGNDFDSFWDAGASVWHERELLHEKGTERYLPSFQVLMAPLGALPLPAAGAVWLVITAASYVGLVWTFARVFGVSPHDQLPAWLCVAPFVISNVTLGQNGALLLALSTAGVGAAALGRDARAGAALALAALFKVLPAALFAVPLGLARIGRTLAGATAAGAAVAVAMAVAIGLGPAADASLRWVTEVRADQTPAGLVEGERSLRYNNQGLAITLARTFGEIGPQPRKRAKGSTPLASLPLAWIWAAYGVLLATLCGVFAAVVWRVRTRRPVGPRAFLGVLGLAVVPMLAASPLVWTHYFLWLLPGFVYLARHRAALGVVAVASFAAIFWTQGRGLGCHMALALAQFAWIATELWRDPQGTGLPVDASEDPRHSGDPGGPDPT
jgi:hypothetical protein